MPDDLYDADILIWSEQQADLLRRAAAGERVNGLDWLNLIEEVESVGRSQINAVESLLDQVLLHLLKCAGWSGSDATRHWRSEAAVFLRDTRRRFSPIMRPRIDLFEMYGFALRQIQTLAIDGAGPCPLPVTCPFTLGELLDDAIPVADCVARLVGARGEDDHA